MNVCKRMKTIEEFEDMTNDLGSLFKIKEYLEKNHVDKWNMFKNTNKKK